MEGVTFVLSVWGAVLSTLLAVLEWRRARRRLRVALRRVRLIDVGNGRTIWHPANRPLPAGIAPSAASAVLVMLEVINVGDVAVPVQRAWLTLPDGRELHLGMGAGADALARSQSNLPRTLAPGERYDTLLDHDHLLQGLTQQVGLAGQLHVRGGLLDERGCRYKSRRLTLARRPQP